MKALLLAAGRGTRVRPLTDTTPKPMLSVLGRPVMEWLVEHLARHGFDEIMVNTSYLSPRIEDYFGDGSRWGVQIGYSFEGHLDRDRLVDEPIGSAGALRRIQDHSGFFDDTALVVCADALCSLDLGAFLDLHRRRGAAASIALMDVPADRVSSYGVVVTGADGRITAFQEKPRREEALSTLVNTGIYLFEPSVIERIPPSMPYDIGGQLFPRLVAEGLPFFGATLPFEWFDIGSVPDYHAVSLAAIEGRVPGLSPGGRAIRHGLHVGLNVRASWDRCRVEGPVVIGSSVRLEPGCSIVGPTLIGAGSVIETGARVERSVVAPYTRVGAGAKLREALVSPSYAIDASGQTIAGQALFDARRLRPGSGATIGAEQLRVA